ncbi:uncharacterized protein LOC134790349 [Cydia splendana]|uniref:uncharacterized protein LOC134790349 n=1 Tax=Cydia splendana TaxID=1100963 RepID=UPI00300C61D9
MDLSRSTLATAKTLGLEVFQNWSANIVELNLSGIKDLTADQLRPYKESFTSLKTLDITFTKIFLCDLDKICCESIKNIGINFFKPHFFKPSLNVDILRRLGPHKDKDWTNISELFKKQKFEKVHFILLRFHRLEFPIKFMEDISLTKDLKITLADWCGHCRGMSCEEYEPFTDFAGSSYINFEKLSYIFRYCHETSQRNHQSPEWLGGISNLNYTQIEYIFIMHYNGIIRICVSPKMSEIFMPNHHSNIAVRVQSPLSVNFKVRGNIVLKAWNANLTVFDDDFFEALLLELTDYFPTYVCMRRKTKMNATQAPSNWYCIDSCDTYDGFVDNIPENVTLTDVCRKGYLPEWNQPITLKIELGFFKNITFLSVRDVFLKDDFFGHIFLQCKKLHTLDVFIQKRDTLCLGKDCTLSLFTNLHETRLKNLRLHLRDIDYSNIFNSFSKCSSLENIHICDQRDEVVDEASNKSILLFMEKCSNLYNLFIEAEMETDDFEVLEYRLNFAAKKLAKDHLSIQVCYYGCNFNPFADVFNPSPLDITQ